MKYCVNAKQTLEVRKKADEIYVKWEDRDFLSNLDEENPKGTYILEVPMGIDEKSLELKKLQSYQSKIILALSDFKLIEIIKAYGLSFYWKYPVTTYYEIRGLKELGVCYLLLGAPLYFDLKGVKKFGVPIRLVANLAYDNFIPRKDGICGTYVRPEDVPYYEEYVETLEFFSESNKQEEALLRIYKEEQKWNGNLKLIIANLKNDIDNRSLPEEFGTARLQCRQNCMRAGTCHFCETAFIFGKKLDEAKDEWVKKDNV